MMSKVVSIAEARSLVADRAHALLGARPTLTFIPDDRDDGCVCIELRPAGRGSFVGLVADKSKFTERVRLGVRPRFLAHHLGTTPTVCGVSDVRIAGRFVGNDLVDTDLSSSARIAAHALVKERPFGGDHLVVVEVHLAEMRVDEGEGPAHGAIPRT